MIRSPNQSDSWADFKASSDFDPVLWSGIKATGGSNASAALADLEQTNGRGVAYLLHNTGGWSGVSGFISASISGVKFYLDTSGTGIYNPATVQQLTGTLTSNANGGYTLSGIDTTGWVGNATIFVVAYDNYANTSCPQLGQFAPLSDHSKFAGLAPGTKLEFKNILADANKALKDLAKGAGAAAKPPFKPTQQSDVQDWIRKQQVKAPLDPVVNGLWNFIATNWKALGGTGDAPILEKMSAEQVDVVLAGSLIPGDGSVQISPPLFLKGMQRIANGG